MQAILGIILSAILSENFILVKFYGICPFMGVSKKIDTALGMGMVVTFVMAIASAACYAVNVLLVKLSLDYMQTVAFILVIAALVQFIEMFLQKSMPSLYTALGIYLPLITTNCAVLGVVLLNVQNNYNFISSVVYGITGGWVSCWPSCCLPASGSAWCLRLPQVLGRFPHRADHRRPDRPCIHGLLRPAGVAHVRRGRNYDYERYLRCPRAGRDRRCVRPDPVRCGQGLESRSMSACPRSRPASLAQTAAAAAIPAARAARGNSCR